MLDSQIGTCHADEPPAFWGVVAKRLKRGNLMKLRILRIRSVLALSGTFLLTMSESWKSFSKVNFFATNQLSKVMALPGALEIQSNPSTSLAWQFRRVA
jgi:hypothetical protein